jgi:hypothetical protein
MAKKYRISVDHHKKYDITGRGKYGLMIVPFPTSTGNVKELPSEKELRADLGSVGYGEKEIDSILEILSEDGAKWQDTRELQESAVNALGF